MAERSRLVPRFGSSVWISPCDGSFCCARTEKNKQTSWSLCDLFQGLPYNVTWGTWTQNTTGKHSKLQLRLIALDQPECYQDWSIVVRCAPCVVQPGGWREDACEASGGFEKVGILERKQMAHIKSKGPL